MKTQPLTKTEAEKYRYNSWAGEPDGTQYNPSRCVQEVCASGRIAHFYQCLLKPGHGPKQLYCRRHAERFAEAVSTWWCVHSYGTLSEHPVVKVTEKKITFPGGSTQDKHSQWGGDWFPTKLEALKFRLEQSRKECDNLRRSLNSSELKCLKFEREYEEALSKVSVKPRVGEA